MATLSTAYKTLSEWAKGLDPDGRAARVIDLLSQVNPVLKVMPFMEGNLPTGHRTSVQAGLPSAAWRLLNAGVIPTTGTKAQIDEQCGQLESWSQVDKRLAELNGNLASFRMQEAEEHVEAIGQELAQTMFYGNPGAPEEFTGFAARYSAISGAANASHVISGGGSGSDNASIWFMDFSSKGPTGIFPKGSQAGVQHMDHGTIVIQNANGVTGALMAALVDQWRWEAGIALQDWRKCVRICNIDVSQLVAQSSMADLVELLIRAYHRIRNKKNCHIFACPTVVEYLDIQNRDAVIAGGGLNYSNVAGEEMLTFRGIPIHSVDALLETEATVS